MEAQLTFSEAVCRLNWTFALGVVTAKDVNQVMLEGAANRLQATLRAEREQAFTRTDCRIKAFEEYFIENGYVCPLRQQFEAQFNRSLPGTSLVRALLISEGATGLLMGMQNLAVLEGDLHCDVARNGDSFQGMRHPIQCRPGDIVLKDSQGIIANLFQGPDHRTRLKKNTKDVIVFVFGAPSITPSEVAAGAHFVTELFQNVSSNVTNQVLTAHGVSR